MLWHKYTRLVAKYNANQAPTTPKLDSVQAYIRASYGLMLLMSPSKNSLSNFVNQKNYNNNSSHLHCFCMGILFYFIAFGIHCC